MPLLDLPLSELKQYGGRNPRPADFDAYWNDALAELDRVDPAPALTPARDMNAGGIACFDLYFTGVRGARIHAKYARPRQARPRSCPAVLAFHGYTGNAGDWLPRLAYAHEGMAVAAMDCRGQGGLSQDSGAPRGTTLFGHIIRGLDDPDPTALLYRQIFLDTVQLARALKRLPEIDPLRFGTMGASQGGGLALACAALEPAVVATSAVFPFLCDYQRVWEMDLAKDAYAELRDFFRRFDPLHTREAEWFTRLGYIDVQHLAPRIRAQVLFTTALMDSVCPPSTQFAAYNRIPGRKELRVYPDFGHEQLPGEADATFAFLHAALLPGR